MQRKANWLNPQRDLNSNVLQKVPTQKTLILKILFLTPGHFQRSDAATFLLSTPDPKHCFCSQLEMFLSWPQAGSHHSPIAIPKMMAGLRVPAAHTGIHPCSCRVVEVI